MTAKSRRLDASVANRHACTALPEKPNLPDRSGILIGRSGRAAAVDARRSLRREQAGPGASALPAPSDGQA